MRQIVIFTVALFFTFAYCATRFTAAGVMYCPHKKHWHYTVELWEGIKGKTGTRLTYATGIVDVQVQFYELSADTDITNYPDGHLGIDIYHNCTSSGAHTTLWGGYSMFVPLDGGNAYGFNAHNLGKTDESLGVFNETRAV